MGASTVSACGVSAGVLASRAFPAPNRTTTLSAPRTSADTNARSTFVESTLAEARDTTGASQLPGSTNALLQPLRVTAAISEPIVALRPPGGRTMFTRRETRAPGSVGVHDEQAVSAGEDELRAVG